MSLYLVTGEYVDPGPLLPPHQVVQMLDQLVIPSFEALAKLEKDKKILGGGIVAGARGAAFIVNVASNDELNRMIMELPFWGVVNWKATPLQGFKERAVDEKKAMERIKASIK